MSAWTVEEWQRNAAWAGHVVVEGGVDGLLRVQLELTAQLGALLAERLPVLQAVEGVLLETVGEKGGAEWGLISAMERRLIEEPHGSVAVAINETIYACTEIAHAWLAGAPEPKR